MDILWKTLCAASAAWLLTTGSLLATTDGLKSEMKMEKSLNLTHEWDKVSPLSNKVNHRKVTFTNRYGITLAADMYVPKQAEGKLPAIAVSGPCGAVKEQSSGLYAMTLAERGFLTIAFDPSYTGESGGEPRYVASPDINTEDFSAAVDFLHEETPLTISRRAYLEGMRCAAANTALMGRWQTLAESPLTVCDTGHNAHGIAYVADQLKATPHRELYCVIGFVRDKDLAHILPLLPRDAHYIFTQAHSERALPAAELTAKAAIYGLRGEAVEEVTAAVARAKELAAPEDMIFIGGSTYVVAEAL